MYFFSNFLFLIIHISMHFFSNFLFLHIYIDITYICICIPVMGISSNMTDIPANDDTPICPHKKYNAIAI